MWRLFWRILFLVFSLLQFAQMLGVLWDQLFIFRSFFLVHFITKHSSHFYSTVYRLNPLKRTEHIQNTTQKVLKEYSMNEKVTCTCDGATSNKKAYEGERSECNSHLFDNVLRHFLWSNKSTAKFKGTKNGLTYEESQLICMHMDFITDNCKSI